MPEKFPPLTTGIVEAIATADDESEQSIRSLEASGNITLVGTGSIRTSADGQRVELAAGTQDRILLYTGDDDEGRPGSLRAATAGSGATRSLNTALWAPEWDDGDTGGIYLVMASASYDDSTYAPAAIYAYTGDSALTPRVQLQNDIYFLVLGAGYIHINGTGNIRITSGGSAATPAIGMGSGEDTGFFEKSDGVIGVTSNGTEILEISSSGFDQEAWTAPSMSNSWVNYGSGYQTARYRKDRSGVVRIEGLIKSGSAGTVFTLPAGYRPAATQMFSARGNTGMHRYNVTSAGVVSFTTYDTNYMTLNCEFAT